VRDEKLIVFIPHYPNSYDPWIAISSRVLPGWVETHTARPLQAEPYVSFAYGIRDVAVLNLP